MSNFTLKLIALVAMLIDHIGQFIPNMPVWVHWIGRLSAPIFIFCCIYSFKYTTNRNGYLLRLYLAGVIMSILQWQLKIPNNFFRTLFSLTVIIQLLEWYRKKENFGKRFILYLLWQFGSIGLIVLLLSTSNLSEYFIGYIVSAVLGSVFYLEGGMVYVVLGTLFWVFRENKVKLAVSFCIFDVFLFGLTTTSIVSLTMGWMRFHCPILNVPLEIVGYLIDTVIGLPPVELGGSMWSENYEWMMIGALPILLLYNYKKGYSVKWFFYIFYPVHIVILWCLSHYLFL